MTRHCAAERVCHAETVSEEAAAPRCTHGRRAHRRLLLQMPPMLTWWQRMGAQADSGCGAGGGSGCRLCISRWTVLRGAEMLQGKKRSTVKFWKGEKSEHTRNEFGAHQLKRETQRAQGLARGGKQPQAASGELRRRVCLNKSNLDIHARRPAYSRDPGDQPCHSLRGLAHSFEAAAGVAHASLLTFEIRCFA